MADQPVIAIGHLKITDHLALGVTIDKLEKAQETFQHFKLETRPYRGWNPLADDLRKGVIQGAFILAPLAMELFYSGVKIKLILQGHKSGSIIIKNKRAGINGPLDFKGKTVLIPHYLSVHHLLFHRLLHENGLDIGKGAGVGKDIVFEVVAPSDIPDIMEMDEKGTVGGFIVAEPFGSQVVKDGYGEEFALSKDLWPKHPCCVLVIQQAVIEHYPDAVQELTNSLVASGHFIEEHRADEACVIGAKFLGQDEGVIKHVLTEPPDRVVMNEMFPVMADLEYLQEYMTTHIHALSGKIDLSAFVDTRFAEKAGAR